MVRPSAARQDLKRPEVLNLIINKAVDGPWRFIRVRDQQVVGQKVSVGLFYIRDYSIDKGAKGQGLVPFFCGCHFLPLCEHIKRKHPSVVSVFSKH